MNNVNTILNNINPCNPKFEGTKFESWSTSPATSKGRIGEEVAKAIFEENGDTVLPRSTKEHDLIINNKKVEVKTAFERKCSKDFSLYGIDATEDWHWALFQLVTPKGIYGFKVDRATLANIYLSKTRKNAMCTVTLDHMKNVSEQVYFHGV